MNNAIWFLDDMCLFQKKAIYQIQIFLNYMWPWPTFCHDLDLQVMTLWSLISWPWSIFCKVNLELSLSSKISLNKNERECCNFYEIIIYTNKTPCKSDWPRGYEYEEWLMSKISFEVGWWGHYEWNEWRHEVLMTSLMLPWQQHFSSYD